MSKDGTTLLIEGFLQKRKDTMKIRWATYWFRLQNTTLFFYTKENCKASHLKGYYYIYTVQSVREVQREDSKRFMFEIIMKNGKRKMLSAETADLRKEWVNKLWQAMHLSNSGFSNSRSSHLDVCDHRDRINSIVPISSQTDSVMESLPPRPLSAPTVHVHRDISSITSPACLSESPDEEPTYQNLELPCSNHNEDGESLDSQQGSTGFDNTDRGPEGDYDVLPIRTKVCEINTITEEVVYDVPVCHRRADEQTESIYDVPSSLLRKASFHNSDFDPLLSQVDAVDAEEQLMNEVYWRL